MAEKSGSITVAETRKPSRWNSGLYTGLLFGMAAIGSVVAGVAVTGGGSLAALAPLVQNGMGWVTGAAATALLGGIAYSFSASEKKTIELNTTQKQDRVISPPTIWNRGLMNGLLLGLVVGAAALTGVSLLAVAGLASPLVAGAAAMSAAFAGFTTYYAGNRHKEWMTQAYDAAQHGEQIVEKDTLLTHLIKKRGKDKDMVVDEPDMAMGDDFVPAHRSHQMNSRDPALAALRERMASSRSLQEALAEQQLMEAGFQRGH